MADGAQGVGAASQGSICRRMPTNNGHVGIKLSVPTGEKEMGQDISHARAWFAQVLVCLRCGYRFRLGWHCYFYLTEINVVIMG